MRRTIIYIVGFGVLVALLYCGYLFVANFTYTRHITLPAHLLASTSTDVTADDQASTTAPEYFGQTDLTLLSPASSTVDMSKWKKYVNNELGFSVMYPGDFTVNTDTYGSLILAVPKDHYFHWPLLDDVTISVVASSSCPELQGGIQKPVPVMTRVNDYDFARTEGSDVGAGNLYRELAYDMVYQGTCYHIDLFDHGANGAGLYVSDQALITRYETQHQKDLDGVIRTLMGIIKSFRIVETDAGIPEDQISP